jgi:hypothetical protein
MGPEGKGRTTQVIYPAILQLCCLSSCHGGESLSTGHSDNDEQCLSLRPNYICHRESFPNITSRACISLWHRNCFVYDAAWPAADSRAASHHSTFASAPCEARHDYLHRLQLSLLLCFMVHCSLPDGMKRNYTGVAAAAITFASSKQAMAAFFVYSWHPLHGCRYCS